MAKKKDASEDAPEDEAPKDADGDETGGDDGGDGDDGDKKGKKDKKDKKKDKDKDGPPEEPSARAGYIGLGLVGSLVVGFDPLRDAFQGNGSFENAILRFLACVAVCVVGAGTIGRMIDASAPEPEEANPDEVELDADGNPILGEGDEAAALAADTADNAAAADDAASGEQTPGDAAGGAESADGASSDADKNETIPVGSARSGESVRQGTEQQPLTSSEETS